MTEFNSAIVLQSLEEAFQVNSLNRALTEHWAQYVPSVFTAKPDADSGREERKAEKFLFRPMEAFLCNGDPSEVFRVLKQKDQPPNICGKVFKVGEPTYSCRDCSMDSTCVLCIDCFQKSAHKKHRYKMSTSGGGGYCDCGDREAWKSEPFCDFHKQGSQTQQNTNPIDNLPEDIRERATQIFYSTVDYVCTMLLWQQPEDLPAKLKPVGERKDTFITMLFNDEIHTYDQVINWLEKSVKCSHKEAVDHATTVDREGRSPIFYGRYPQCCEIKRIIEHHTARGGNNPLKVVVMHSSVVSHQTFAQKVLAWLQDIIAKSDGLRQLFCSLSLQTWPGQDKCIVEKMMLADTQLWKACRIQSHQLFMSGILRDLESKKQFAVLFTKMYPCLMKAFIQDDHEHSVCAISEAVQIFTVPTLNYSKVMANYVRDDLNRKVSITSASVQLFTVHTLAKMLITDHDLLRVILSTFLEDCKTKLNDKGKLVFERQSHTPTFRRAQYMLYDLKYALTCIPQPEEWTPKLRTNFIHGIEDLLQLLKYIQGMDAVVRQVTEHIEFEPEWEGAFNLQLKLQDIISMVIDWAGSDMEVLKKTFILTLAAASDCWGQDSGTVPVGIFGHKADCIDYTVAKEPVSIHLPVTRFLAGLCPKQILLGAELQQICAESELSPVALMEPALRCQVLVAQTSAGMWRRNGYSLVNQIYFYHNVRCRSEMYDRDILMLQVGAAMIDPDEFLIHILYKFGVQKWLEPPKTTGDKDKEKDREGDNHRQIVNLADELLHMLLIILNERYVPGVGEVGSQDSTKREIIHQLCIQPMAHSELIKALPEHPYHDISVDEVVHEVATFHMPKNIFGKGIYEVKPSHYKDYTPFFYHYAKTEQAKSEEAQRKRLAKQEKDNPGSTCGQALIPPVPPAFTAGFSPIIKILHCDTFVHLMRMVLERAQAKYVRWYTDAHLDKVFHLIGLALHEEKRAHENNDHSFKFIEKALTEHEGGSLLSLLEKLVGHSNITHASQVDLLNWLVRYFAEVRQLRDSSYKPDPSAYPVLTADQLEAQRKKEKKAMADIRRQRVMSMMSKMQKNFIKDNKNIWDETDVEQTSSEIDSEATMAEILAATDHPVGVGPNRTDAYVGPPVRHICILCQEKDDIMHNGRAMVLAGFVQKSTVLSKKRGEQREDPEAYDPLFMQSTRTIGAFVSSCGHAMHADCWQKYFDSVVSKERRLMRRFRHHLSYDIEKCEFLCPLCECLANTVIPIIPCLPTLLKQREKTEVQLSLNDWLDGIQKTVNNSIQEDQDSAEESFLFVPCPLSSITKMMAESVAKNFQLLFDYVYDDASNHFSDSITLMLHKFSSDCYAFGLGVNPDESNTRVPVMGWSCCAFSIMAIETSLREEKKPLFGSLTSRSQDCLNALVRFSAVCSQVMQQETVRKHCIRLLSALVIRNIKDRHVHGTPHIRDMDLFHYLVCLCLSLPTLYAEDDPTATKLTRIPTGGLNDHHVLKLVFTAHLVQVILAAQLEPCDSMETDEDEDDAQLLQWYIKIKQLGGQDTSNPPSTHQIKTYIKEACLPFLRCCTLFFNQLTEVRPPSGLFDDSSDQFGLICGYLDLPLALHNLFNQSELLTQFVHSWCMRSDEPVNCIQYPPLPNQLIRLPDDYIELINRISKFTCPKSEGDDSHAPTMCLVCGKMLCSQSYCCQSELDGKTVGAATAHAELCGAGTCLFLRVRECQVLLLYGTTKGCFSAPPYLDVYGETDQGLRRGNPLHLCHERYKKLQTMWLNHRIPEEIVHVLESNSNLLSIEWHNL